LIGASVQRSKSNFICGAAFPLLKAVQLRAVFLELRAAALFAGLRLDGPDRTQACRSQSLTIFTLFPGQKEYKIF
jgi:hypothetical protein